MGKKFLTAAETAEICNVGHDTISVWRRSGKFPVKSQNVDGIWMYNANDVKKFVKNGGVLLNNGKTLNRAKTAEVLRSRSTNGTVTYYVYGACKVGEKRERIFKTFDRDEAYKVKDEYVAKLKAAEQEQPEQISIDSPSEVDLLTEEFENLRAVYKELHETYQAVCAERDAYIAILKEAMKKFVEVERTQEHDE